jgi:hypothetical protein
MVGWFGSLPTKGEAVAGGHYWIDALANYFKITIQWKELGFIL